MLSCPFQVHKRYIHTESGLPLTVKYVGPLPPLSDHNSDVGASGPTWIGVEWDDPKRGKHSGIFQNHQVFHTRVPGAASFLKFKPAKRTNSANDDALHQTEILNAGKGFFQAVYERYIDSRLKGDYSTIQKAVDDANGSDLSSAVEKVVLGSSNGQIVVEMPNLDKIVRKLRKGVDDAQADDCSSGMSIKEIGLEGQWVYGVEEEGGVASMAVEGQGMRWQTLRGKLNNVHTLNLSRNLLPSWLELAEICLELPNLRVLVVNFSRMEHLQKPLKDSLPQRLETAFAKIEGLHICHSLLTWIDARLLSSAFPALRVLDLAGNPLLDERLSVIARLPSEFDDLQRLQSLDLSDCGMNKWQEIIDILAETPGLQALNISSNSLSSIDLPTSLPKLPALDTIVMNEAMIRDWQSIDNLQILFGSSLRTLKFSLAEELSLANSRISMPPHTGRFQGTLEDRVYLISKLPALETLNGTRITPNERKDAERFYLAKAAGLGIVGDDMPGWGRLKELRRVHGGSKDGPSTTFATTTLKSKMIDIVVECPELGVEPFTLSLLPTAPLKLLKTKIARQLGVPINSRFGLSVREAGSKDAHEMAVEDRTNLSNLGLKEGDVVVAKVL